MDLLIFAVIAAFLIYRLLQTIGQTDEENPNDRPSINFPMQGPGMTTAQAIDLPIIEEIIVSPDTESENPEVAKNLKAIHKLDPDFTEKYFLQGTKKAFEYIINSFADGDLESLGELLSPSLYKVFADEIAKRELQKEITKFYLSAIKSCKIKEVKLYNKVATITVELVSDQMAIDYIKGEKRESYTKSFIDLWTFSRDLKNNNPNWLLKATN